jgi:hypothetical protein
MNTASYVTFGLALVIGAPSMSVKAAEVISGRSQEISSLLVAAEHEAIELKHDAVDMEGMIRSRVNRAGQSAAVTRVKEHINECGELLARMAESREAASPLQSQAIDQITPLLRQMATNTSSFIDLISAGDPGISRSELQQSANVNSELAAELTTLISNFVDYEKTMERQEELRTRLNVR